MRTDQDHRGLATAVEEARLARLCDGLAETLHTAEALVRSRRRIDLAGLDQQVRELCALILALPGGAAAVLGPKLQVLLARTEALLAGVAAGSAAAAP